MDLEGFSIYVIKFQKSFNRNFLRNWPQNIFQELMMSPERWKRLKKLILWSFIQFISIVIVRPLVTMSKDCLSWARLTIPDIDELIVFFTSHWSGFTILKLLFVEFETISILGYWHSDTSSIDIQFRFKFKYPSGFCDCIFEFDKHFDKSHT